MVRLLNQRYHLARIMARVGFFYHDVFLDHDTGPHHPERPDRLRAIVAGLKSANLFDRLVQPPFGPADDEWLRLIHTQAYIDRLRKACAAGDPYIDTPDSAICPRSEEIARRAVGAVLTACDAVVRADIDRAFCAIRPPGHHARAGRSAGFCLYNNTAIAARYLQQRHGIERVFILDWDVHHGDGTQETFLQDPSVFVCSLHEDPRYCYPGSGYAYETGAGAGSGATLNIPMLPGASDDEYRQALEQRVRPALDAFAPQFLLVSNGLDAHADDPLAGLRLTDQAFTWMMQQACDMADRWCQGRLVVALEGGYDLGALSRCVPSQIAAMLGE